LLARDDENHQVMYDSFGEQRAFFVSQGINLLYVIYGGAVLYPRMYLTNDITDEMKAIPKVNEQSAKVAVTAPLVFTGRYDDGLYLDRPAS